MSITRKSLDTQNNLMLQVTFCARIIDHRLPIPTGRTGILLILPVAEVSGWTCLRPHLQSPICFPVAAPEQAANIFTSPSGAKSHLLRRDPKISTDVQGHMSFAPSKAFSSWSLQAPGACHACHEATDPYQVESPLARLSLISATGFNDVSDIVFRIKSRVLKLVRRL